MCWWAFHGEESIAALCRREGIAESLYYTWSKELLEIGKKRLAGDTARLYRGIKRLRVRSTLTMAACNLAKLPKLLAT